VSTESKSLRPARGGRPFQKGQSGNPNGRPKGSKNRATVLAQSLIDGRARALVEKTLDLALDGNLTCLRICLERLVSPKKDAPIEINLPEIGAIADIPKLYATVTAKLREGTITPSETGPLIDLFKAFSTALENVELEQRISALERNSKK